MSTDDQEVDLARGIRTSLRTNATAYAYSVFITICFAIVDITIGGRSVPRIFLFLAGATVAFGLTEAVASRGFRDRFRPEPADVVMLGSAMATISVGSAGAVVWLTGSAVGGATGWFAGPFLGTITYVLISGAEMAVARRREDDDPPERER